MNSCKEYSAVHLCMTPRAPSNLLHMKSKLDGFDKLGAWPIHVNFQPWQQTPATLGAGSLHILLSHGLLETEKVTLGVQFFRDVQYLF